MPQFDISAVNHDEVFTLKESDERDNYHKVEVFQNGRSKLYVASLGRYRGEAQSMAEALHQLANAIDAAGVYGAEGVSRDALHRRGRLRPCQYCDGTIFFAKTANGKWMPVEADRIDAKLLKKTDIRAFIVVDLQGEPAVKSLSTRGGQVWIAHPDVCGVRTDEPPVPELAERWRKNRENAKLNTEEAVADLQKTLRDLT